MRLARLELARHSMLGTRPMPCARTLTCLLPAPCARAGRHEAQQYDGRGTTSSGATGTPTARPGGGGSGGGGTAVGAVRWVLLA